MCRERGKEETRERNGREAEWSRAPLASLCLSRRAADDLHASSIKQTRQKTCNQSDTVK